MCSEFSFFTIFFEAVYSTRDTDVLQQLNTFFFNRLIKIGQLSFNLDPFLLHIASMMADEAPPTWDSGSTCFKSIQLNIYLYR